MVVYQSCSLHKGITDCGSNKLKAPLFEFSTHHSGLLGLCWHFRQVSKGVLNCFSMNELPDEGIKRAKFLLDLNKLLRVDYSCGYFGSILNYLGAFIRRSKSSEVYFATFTASKPSNASLNIPRRSKINHHDNPA
jgi:hypothetical protein